MYQTESQTTTRTVKAASCRNTCPNTDTEVLCYRFTESPHSIHAVTRLSTMLGLPAETIADLLAPLGLLQGRADITRLGSLLRIAKRLGVIEEYCLTKEPHCLGEPLTVEPVGVDMMTIRAELPSGWLVELDLPGTSAACEERFRQRIMEEENTTTH